MDQERAARAAIDFSRKGNVLLAGGVLCVVSGIYLFFKSSPKQPSVADNQAPVQQRELGRGKE